MRELTDEDLKLFSSFEKITGVMPSDCASSSSTLVFLVDKKELGKAIGKNAKNIKRLEELFKKRVTIIKDAKDPETLIRNFFGNIKIFRIDSKNVMGEENYTVVISEEQRGIAIGRNGERIKMLKTLLKNRYNATVHIKTRKMFNPPNNQ